MLKSFRILISLTLIIFSSFIANCQFNVKGIVIDQNEEPIPFANVIFSGTELGTLTNFKGEFELSSS